MPTFGADTSNILAVPLPGNRIERFIWNGMTSTLTFDHNLIKRRAFQNDGGPVFPGAAEWKRKEIPREAPINTCC